MVGFIPLLLRLRIPVIVLLKAGIQPDDMNISCVNKYIFILMYNRLIAIVLYITLSGNVFSQFTLELESHATGLRLPVDITSNGSDHLFVVEKPGVIKVIDPDGQVLVQDFLDITDRVNATRSEEGLLGLAFHPDFDNNGEFYVNYTDFRDLTVISRFKIFPGEPFRADPDSEEEILRFSQPFNNHNGGDVAFGPDGYLYIASGDGGSANDPFNNAQTGTTLLGKILRIDVDDTTKYKIPTDNPFIGNAGVLDEIWALGLRNPWRISFDRESGDFWIGDVGQDTWEEINYQKADSPGGHNYGWKCYEGNHEFQTGSCQPMSSYDFPIFEYNNNKTQAGCSITGGYVYRGSNFPEMYGWYIYSDYCSGKFWALSAEDTTNISVGDFGSNQFATFGEDDDGELYVAAIQAGVVYKVGVKCELEYNLSKTDQQCPDQADGSLKLEITTPDVEAKITWSSGDTTEEVNNLFPRWYFVNIKAGACDITDSIEILPSDISMSCLVDSANLINFCEGDTAVLEACQGESGYEYQWYIFDAILTKTTEPFLKITESGVYSMSLIGDCNLGVSDEVELIFHEIPGKPELQFSADTLFTSLISDRYKWCLNDTLLVETTDSFIVVQKSGDYSVSGISGENCEGEKSDSYTVVISSLLEGNLGEINVYPNPVSDEFNIELSVPQNGTIMLLAVDGKVLETRSLAPTNIFSLINYPDGIYFTEIKSDNGHEIIKVIKKSN
jgi:glucose/arabinose dehydrogenase